MKRQTTDLLSCPILDNNRFCGGNFEAIPSESRGDEILSGSLICSRDKSHQFQIRDFELKAGVVYASTRGTITCTKGIPDLESSLNMREYRQRGLFPSKDVFSRYTNSSVIRMSHKCEYGPFLNHPSESCEKVYSTVAAMARKTRGKGRLLDLGCGLGRALVDLEGDFGCLVGLDSSPSMIASAKQIVQSRGLNVSFELMAHAKMHGERLRSFGCSRTDFVVGNAHWIPFKRSVFDCVIASFLIDRLHQPMLVLDEITRVLESGGTLVLVDPYDWDPDTTPRNLWMEKADVQLELQSRGYHVQESIDNIPYAAVIHPRKTIAYEAHAILARKLG